MIHRKSSFLTWAVLTLLPLATGGAIAAQDAPLSGDELSKYVGTYEQDNIDGPIRVTIRNGYLTVEVRGRPPIRMKHVGGHKFLPDGMPDATIVFKVRKGRVAGYTFRSPEETNVATRIEDAERKAGDVTIETKTLRDADGGRIEADFGRLVVPENRTNPGGNLIELAFVRLKSTSKNPKAPLIYLNGGPGGSSTPQARSPQALSRWAHFLPICDVILLDQRGCGSSSPRLHWTPEDRPPTDLFSSEQRALEYMLDVSRKAAQHFRERGVDLAGYTTAESADDLNDLRIALGAKKISLFGFSYGTHLAQAVIRRHGEHLENVVICGVEGLAMTHKYPLNMDIQFRKLALMAANDPGIAPHVPDLVALLDRVLEKLEREPIDVEIVDPQSRKRVKVPVGKFGLQVILRFDIGDASDLPVFPKLLYTIDQGDPSVLKWFVQKRFSMFRGVNVLTWVMDGASGASPQRWARIRAEAKQSAFGNVMNFPYPQVKKAYGVPDLGADFRAPLISDVRTLFLSGTLDWNTPPHQAEEVRWGFSNATHLIVENAGHEQILPQPAIGKAILDFLRGKDVHGVKVVLPPLKFVPIEGTDRSVTHPAVARR